MRDPPALPTTSWLQTRGRRGRTVPLSPRCTGGPQRGGVPLSGCLVWNGSSPQKSPRISNIIQYFN